MVCKITEDIREIIGDDKLIEVTRYVCKRMNYSFESGKKKAQKELVEEMIKATEEGVVITKEALRNKLSSLK